MCTPGTLFATFFPLVRPPNVYAPITLVARRLVKVYSKGSNGSLKTSRNELNKNTNTTLAIFSTDSYPCS